jgi:hypothetical protein
MTIRESRRMRRTGAALLEVLVALTILVTAGATVAGFASEAANANARSAARERSMRDASAFLEAVALWPRADLDRHLGDRVQGPWRMRVDRPTPTLYVIVLADSTNSRELLRTALYRPQTDEEQQK